MTDERFEEFLKKTAQDYNQPPETPRAEMWARIDAARAKRRGERELDRAARPWVRWGAGIAALLALGIGIGRMTAPPPRPGGDAGPIALATEDTTNGSDVVLRLAAADYLARTDAFLSLFRAEARAGQAGVEVARWARDLLLTARMMMDSPVGEDPNLRELFEDLELILVQITHYTVNQSTEELELIEQGLEVRSVQLRLEALLAMGDEVMLAQGAI